MTLMYGHIKVKPKEKQFHSQGQIKLRSLDNPEGLAIVAMYV